MKNHRLPLSIRFPVTHPRSGEPTGFREAIDASLNGISYIPGFAKHHTIRSGHKVKVGDTVTFYSWTGRPYHSPQQVEFMGIPIVKLWDIEISCYRTNHCDLMNFAFDFGNDKISFEQELIANNDGFCIDDLHAWLNPKDDVEFVFIGQIICWNNYINY